MYKAPTALAPALYIPGLLYEALVRMRNRMYSAAIVPQHRLPNPVISIGNVTMGGTGKTPLVIYLANALSKLGFTPAILTRGYGRSGPSEMHILAPGEAAANPAMALGDEPALIRRRVPSSWMGVAKTRFAAGREISKRDPKVVFVLDDGFQHRALARDLDILILDSSHHLGSDRIFPRGTLREPLSALHRCDAIVINGDPDSAETRSMESEIRKLGSKTLIFHCDQSILSLCAFSVWQQAQSRQCFNATPAVEKPANKPSCYLVSAIGNPRRFRKDIQRLGLECLGEKSFPDHHRIMRADWKECVEQARRMGADAIITTEKDAIKMNESPDFPLLVAQQSTRMAEAVAFELLLKKVIEECK